MPKSVHITDKLTTEPLSVVSVVFQQLSETEVCPDISISDAPRPKSFSRKMGVEYKNVEDHVFADTVCSKEHSLRETGQGPLVVKSPMLTTCWPEIRYTVP